MIIWTVTLYEFAYKHLAFKSVSPVIFSSLLLKCSTSPTKNENSIYNYGLLFFQNHHLPIDSFYLYDQSGLGKDICRYFLVVKRPPKALASVGILILIGGHLEGVSIWSELNIWNFTYCLLPNVVRRQRRTSVIFLEVILEMYLIPTNCTKKSSLSRSSFWLTVLLVPFQRVLAVI